MRSVTLFSIFARRNVKGQEKLKKATAPIPACDSAEADTLYKLRLLLTSLTANLSHGYNSIASRQWKKQGSSVRGTLLSNSISQ